MNDVPFPVWLGGVDTLAISAIIGFLIIWWMMRQFRMRSQVRDTDVLKMKDLRSALAAVTDWYMLGVYLSLETYELMRIEENYPRNERRMSQMLDLWLRRTPKPTWGDLVRALQEMGENKVAEIICQNYIREESKSS